jgi:hypothetical protein
LKNIFVKVIDIFFFLCKSSKVHFAGEATDYKYISTVHGAYQSGLRSARNMIKILNKNKVEVNEVVEKKD